VFLAGVLADVGFRQLPIEVDKTESGVSTYSALARLRLALGATVAFSRRPIEYLLYLGLGMLILTVLSGLIRLVWALASGQPIGNFSLLIFSVWLVGSLIICGMGVVGIYVAQSNLDVKGRPYTIVSDIFDFETRPSNSSAE
jgi:putative glycosyltransferase